jgi:hypothetical protein
MTRLLGILVSSMLLASCAGGQTPGAAAPTGTPKSVETPASSDTSSPARPTAHADVSPAPSIEAEPTLGGEFPGPDATVWPGAPVLRDVRLEDLAELWASLGLSCESYTTGGPESPAAYNVHCERMEPAANLHVVTDAGYWTTDGVAVISVTATAIDDGSIDGPVAATQWILPFVRLAGGESAVQWLQQRLADQTCPDKCNEHFRGSLFSFGTGSLGTQSLHVVARDSTQ